MSTEKLANEIVAKLVPALTASITASFEKIIDAKFLSLTAQLTQHGAEVSDKICQQTANRAAELLRPCLNELVRDLKAKMDDVGQECLITGTRMQEAIDGIAMTGASAKRAKAAAPKLAADPTAAPAEKVPASALAYFKEQYRGGEEFRVKILDMPGIRKAVTESKFVAEKKAGTPKLNAEADIAFKSLEQTAGEWMAEFKREHAAKKAAKTAADAIAGVTTETAEPTTPQ